MIALLAACGGDRSGGPRGTPQAVVRAAPDRTVAVGRARVHAAGPGVVSTGTVDFAAHRSQVTVAGPGSEKATAELRDPVVAIDIVRSASKIEPYGGTEVRGVATMKYELQVTPAGARPFFADVWIDSERRIRRVLVPTDKTKPRPERDDPDRLDLITIDFYGFGKEP